MSDTPRTDAVYKANLDLGHGSIVSVPEGHPQSDPWELARQLERELNEAYRRLSCIAEVAYSMKDDLRKMEEELTKKVNTKQ